MRQGTNRLDYYAKWREAGGGRHNRSVIGAKEKSFVLRSIHDILSSYEVQEITMIWSVSIELAVLL